MKLQKWHKNVKVFRNASAGALAGNGNELLGSLIALFRCEQS